MQYSVKRGLEIACCLSVTLVDCDHIGWKSWKLIARTISPTPSLFAAQGPSTCVQGNMGKFERLEVGWEKVAGWSTKASISLKRVKIEESYYGEPIGSHKSSFERYQPRPLRPPVLQGWGSQPHPKTEIAIIAGTAKATECKFGRYIHRVHP